MAEQTMQLARSSSKGRQVIWLLGEPEDTDLLWLAVALRRRDVDVEFVLPEDILIGAALSVRIDSQSSTSILRLRDGRVLSYDSPGLVVNRLTTIPPIGRGIMPGDAAYLSQEWHAALAAWLRTLRCPILNPPRAGSLAGPTMLPAAWRNVARAHGLRARPWSSTVSETLPDVIELVCLGAHCFDPTSSVPAEIQASLTAMARFVGAPLLGATFTQDGDHWVFVEATASPRLALLGDQLVEGLVDFARSGRFVT